MGQSGGGGAGVSNIDHLDKPIMLKAIKNGQNITEMQNCVFPLIEHAAIKSHPRIPLGSDFTIATGFQDTNAKNLFINMMKF